MSAFGGLGVLYDAELVAATDLLLFSAPNVGFLRQTCQKFFHRHSRRFSRTRSQLAVHN
jgi:hypothetical protein